MHTLKPLLQYRASANYTLEKGPVIAIDDFYRIPGVIFTAKKKKKEKNLHKMEK